MHSKFSTIDNDCLHMFLNISLMFKRKGKSKKKKSLIHAKFAKRRVIFTSYFIGVVISSS